jgi:hypothetical protein
MATTSDTAYQFMKDVRFLIFLFKSYFEIYVREAKHDEDGERRCSSEIVSKFRNLLSLAQGSVALSQLTNLPEGLSPFTTQETSRQMIGSRDNVFRLRDQLLLLLYTIEAALDSPGNQSEDDTYSKETTFLEVIRDLGGRHEIMLRIAKLEKMQGPYE